MKTIINNVSTDSHLENKKIFWLTSLVFGFSNVVSQTEMAKNLSKDGADVYLFAMAPKRDGRKTSGPHIILFPMKFASTITTLLYTVAAFIFIPFYIVIKNPDYIITDQYTTTTGFALRLFYPRLKARFVLDIRSTPITAQGAHVPRIGAFRAYLKSLVFKVSIILAKEKFDGITILTELMKKQLCREFSISPKFVGVWTSGVSAELFNPGNFDGMETRKKLGLENKFIIFYHGALGGLRGIDDAIKSMGELKDQCGSLVFFILGEGWYESNLKKLAKQVAAEDRIIFHKKVPYTEVPKYIAMSDVGIVPLPNSANWRYQCPLKLIEYLAMKKVVIATNIPANREIIGKNKCGIYLSSTHPKEIGKAIAFAYDNRKMLREWGTIGRAIVEEKYTWEKIARDFENYLLTL